MTSASVLMMVWLLVGQTRSDDKFKSLPCVLVVSVVTSIGLVDAEDVCVVRVKFLEKSQNAVGWYDLVLPTCCCGQWHREPVWKEFSAASVIFFGNLLF